MNAGESWELACTGEKVLEETGESRTVDAKGELELKLTMEQ